MSLSVIATEGRLGNHTLPALLTAYFSEYFAFPLSYLPKLVTIQDQIRKTTPLMQWTDSISYFLSQLKDCMLTGWRSKSNGDPIIAAWVTVGSYMKQFDNFKIQFLRKAASTASSWPERLAACSSSAGRRRDRAASTARSPHSQTCRQSPDCKLSHLIIYLIKLTWGKIIVLPKNTHLHNKVKHHNTFHLHLDWFGFNQAKKSVVILCIAHILNPNLRSAFQ